MTTDERLELIRAKAGKHRPIAAPKGTGLHVASHPEDRPAVKRYGPIPWHPEKCWGYPNEFGLIVSPGRLPVWVAAKDRPTPKPCRPKRKARVHPLTRIAEHLPAKRPKLS